VAITTVRAQIAGQWVDLSYDASAHAWVANLDAPDSSFHEPGGYYNITVEAANDSGAVLTVTGDDFTSLRLFVREETPPGLALVSPAEGYITTARPVIVFTATDTGSGVDPDSVTVEGAAGSISRTAIADGYRFTFTPSEDLAEGEHRLRISLSDYDQNTASLEPVYLVDTIPPVLLVDLDDGQTITDDAFKLIRGYASDASPLTVEVFRGGESLGEAEVMADGGFAFSAELAPGENSLTVTARDAAGLETTAEYYFIRLITDRTQEDVDYARDVLIAIHRGEATAAEIEAHDRADLKGRYNFTDVNRVNLAMNFLKDRFNEHGYNVSFTAMSTRSKASAFNQADGRRYLGNLAGLRKIFENGLSSGPDTPPDMEGLVYTEANDIERILVMLDALFPLLRRSYIYSGEFQAGEV